MSIKHTVARPSHVAHVLVAAVSLLFLVAGCGGNGSEMAPDEVTDTGSAGVLLASVDPCALVTAVEAEQILEGLIIEQERPASSNIETRLATCRYVAEQGASVAVLVVMVRGSAEPGEAASAFHAEREGPMGGETVSGIGDDAAWSQDLGLTVLSGERTITISGDVTFEQARTLAEQALERLN